MSIQKQLSEIIDNTKEKLRKSVDILWESSFSSLDYTRTHEIIDAVNGWVFESGKDDYTIKVYIDDSLVKTKPSTYIWGVCSKIQSGDFRSGLIKSIIYGMSKTKNNPQYNESICILDVVQTEAEKYANSILKEFYKGDNSEQSEKQA